MISNADTCDSFTGLDLLGKAGPPTLDTILKLAGTRRGLKPVVDEINDALLLIQSNAPKGLDANGVEQYLHPIDVQVAIRAITKAPCAEAEKLLGDPKHLFTKADLPTIPADPEKAQAMREKLSQIISALGPFFSFDPAP